MVIDTSAADEEEDMEDVENVEDAAAVASTATVMPMQVDGEHTGCGHDALVPSPPWRQQLADPLCRTRFRRGALPRQAAIGGRRAPATPKSPSCWCGTLW